MSSKSSSNLHPCFDFCLFLWVRLKFEFFFLYLIIQKLSVSFFSIHSDVKVQPHLKTLSFCMTLLCFSLSSLTICPSSSWIYTLEHKAIWEGDFSSFQPWASLFYLRIWFFCGPNRLKTVWIVSSDCIMLLLLQNSSCGRIQPQRLPAKRVSFWH